MFFLKYGLDILVDDVRLSEFSDPVKDRREYVSTNPSYVRHDAGKKTYSTLNWFVSVPESGLHFSIKIWSFAATRQNPILAIVFIDGISDYILHLLESNSAERIDTFTDNKKNYFLKFNPTLWIDGNDLRNAMNSLSESHTKYGGMGCVSVYFYKAVRGLKSPEIPNYTLQQIPLIENKGSVHGINLSTTFVEKPGSLIGQARTKPYIGWKPDGKALAVLHLHYRPTYWLKLSEIIPESLFSYQKLNWYPENTDQKSSHLTTPLHPIKTEKHTDLYHQSSDVHTPQDKIFDINTLYTKNSDSSNLQKQNSQEGNINNTIVAESNVKTEIIIIDDPDDDRGAENKGKNAQMNAEKFNAELNGKRIKDTTQNKSDENIIQISGKRKYHQELDEIVDLSKKKSLKWVAIKYEKNF
ncbi:hypothetical protein C1645_875418 [Glomus cerebriforme]|uniref:Uncharacterized protein n=1 Tax=Glomus cerebriforme TaxID=658196 RepID=A0A397T555_9GLOM|nr:hypothetical protein C1645_875418 [Glomus cerebriforme]